MEIWLGFDATLEFIFYEKITIYIIHIDENIDQS